VAVAEEAFGNPVDDADERVLLRTEAVLVTRP
jgi:hypothetical protein